MKFLILSFALVAAIAALDAPIPVLRHDSEIYADGTYHYSYETGNQISAEESGTGGVSAVGSAKWIAPDGTPVEFSYVADANGYVAQGSHIPVAPPVPEAIIRALEWSRAHPYVEADDKGFSNNALKALIGK